MSKISYRQMEILSALHRIGQPAEWGDVWDRVGWSDGSPAQLQMSNFDRTTNALLRRGLIVLDGDNLVKLTDDGRSLVTLAKRTTPLADLVRTLHCIRCCGLPGDPPKTAPCTCACHALANVPGQHPDPDPRKP